MGLAVTKKPFSAIAVPNPTPLLFLMAVILAWNLSTGDKGPFSLTATWAVLAVILVGAVYLLSQRPMIAATILIASGAIARLYVQVFGLKARPEHFAIVLFCLTLPFWYRRDWQKVQWAFPDLMLVLYIASNLGSSLIMSIAPAQTLKWASQQVIVILPYFLLRLFCNNRERFRKCFNILLVVGTCQAAIGVFCFACNVAFGTQFGMEPGQYGNIPGTFGVAYEANILGAISAATFIMALTTYLGERRRILLWGAVISYAGLVVSLARAAVGGTVIVLGALALMMFKAKRIQWPAMKTAGATLLICNVILLPIVGPLYVDRFSTLDVSDVRVDGDTAGRVIVLATAAENIVEHPFLGNGTASYQLLYAANNPLPGFDMGDAPWIGNTEIRILHDTGVVGLIFFLLVVFPLGWRALKILRQEWRPDLLALLLGCVLYAVTFQATEGTLLAFFWVQLGLLGSAVFLAQDFLPDPGTPQSVERPSGGSYS
jgi:O-Antigen ligase